MIGAPYAPRQRDRAAVPGDRYQRCGDGDDRGQPGLGADHAAVPAAGRSWLDQVAVLPLPGPGLARTLHQVSRQGEFEEMADAFWRYSRTALRRSFRRSTRGCRGWDGRCACVERLGPL